jgi:glycosyltransferase involved in cell wall biosynthesis
VETFGNVTLEALSSGCPSIVEKKCGEHLVDHGVNGLTCQCGDAEGFYQVGVLSVRGI